MLIFILLLLASGSFSFVCRNELGKDVEWLVAMRVSGLTRRYIVFDDSSANFRTINDESLTTQMFKDIDPGVDGILMWNDEPPTDDDDIPELNAKSEVKRSRSKKTRLQLGANKLDRNRGSLKRLLQNDLQVNEFNQLSNESETLMRQDIRELLGQSGSSPGMTAHDKGVLYRDSKDGSGFFLLHSVPKFPAIDPRGHKLNPTTPERSTYAQSFVCVSKHAGKQDNFYNQIVAHANGQNSQIYFDSLKITSDIKFEGGYVNEPIEGTPFMYVTKLMKFDADPFEEILVPAFQTGWIAETWGRPYKDDNCNGQFSVINNKQVSYFDTIVSSTKDHSKWAVAINTEDLVCIGGMNHMTSQRKRGGSFLCFKNKGLYNELRYKIMQPTNTSCNISIPKNLTADVTPGSSSSGYKIAIEISASIESHGPVDSIKSQSFNLVYKKIQLSQVEKVAKAQAEASVSQLNSSTRRHSVRTARVLKHTLLSLVESQISLTKQ